LDKLYDLNKKKQQLKEQIASLLKEKALLLNEVSINGGKEGNEGNEGTNNGRENYGVSLSDITG